MKYYFQGLLRPATELRVDARHLGWKRGDFARRVARLAVALVLMLGGASGSVMAQSSVLAQWIGPGDGDWSVENNWNCISNGNSYPCVPNSITNPGTSFTVNIDNTQAVLDLTADVESLALGAVQGDQGGELSVGDSNVLTVASELDVGAIISGSLTVATSGVVSDNKATVALATGAGGSSARVTGAGSQWNTTDELDVGVEARGTLTIMGAGVVNSGSDGANAFIGGGSNVSVTSGNGTVTVTGAGSSWTVGNGADGDLFVGWPGRGTLTISDGGLVSDVQGVVSNSQGAVGTATVSGSGSQWNSSQILLVGSADGHGTLNISSGAVVNDPYSVVGVGPTTKSTSQGTATVTGTGSQWVTSGFFDIGYGQGTKGTVTVEAGGLGSSTAGLQLGDTGGSGTLTLTGAGSQWNNTGGLVTVGGTGKGTLTVEDGATLTAATGLTVSASSSGTLTLSSGGAVNVGNSTYQGIITVGAKGTVTVNQGSGLTLGAYGGSFSNSGQLAVNSGGSVEVENNFTNLPASTLSGGTYQVSGTLTLNVNGGGNITTNDASLTLTGTSSQILNQAGGNALAGFVENASKGSFTLSGNQSLSVGGAFTNAGKLTVSSGSIFTVGGGGSYIQTGGQTTVDGVLATSSTGSFRSGEIFLIGAGSINLKGGSLFGNGGTLSANVSSSDTLTPADSASATGTLAVTGNYTQNATGALDINVASVSQFNQLNVSGAASLGGTLNIGLLSGFVPAVGNSFTILNAGSVTGAFSNVNGTSINGTEHFVVLYNPTNVTLQVVAGAS